MIISNFSVSPNKVAPGETMRVQFTITIEAGDTVNGLQVIGGPEQRSLYSDFSWRLAAGESEVIAFDSVVPTDNSYINKNLAASDTQQFTVPYWYVLLGNFGTRVDVFNPVTYINRGLIPKINALAFERAANGVANDEGENLLTTIKISVGAYADTSTASLRLYYADGESPTSDSDSIDLTSKISTLLTGVTDDAEIITEEFSNSSNWHFLLVFADADESTESSYILPRAFANVHLSGASTGGVCFGGFSGSTEGDPRFESHYPSYLYGGVTQLGSAKASLRAMGIQYGSIAAQSCANGATLFVVTFDAPYESEPSIHLSLRSSDNAANMGQISCMVIESSITTSGFSAYVFNGTSNARSIGLDWMTVGVPQYDADAPIVLQRPVAAMTGYTSGGCTVSASTYYSTTYLPWKAFDYSLATSWASSTSDSAPYIQLQMDVPMKNIAVKVFSRNSATVQNPTAGTIQGSNNGTSWTTIGTFSGWDSTATGKLLGTVQCNNTTAYQYVRINITSHGGSQNYVAIGYITINGEK